jgi:hypothetical protein
MRNRRFIVLSLNYTVFPKLGAAAVVVVLTQVNKPRLLPYLNNSSWNNTCSLAECISMLYPPSLAYMCSRLACIQLQLGHLENTRFSCPCPYANSWVLYRQNETQSRLLQFHCTADVCHQHNLMMGNNDQQDRIHRCRVRFPTHAKELYLLLFVRRR